MNRFFFVSWCAHANQRVQIAMPAPRDLTDFSLLVHKVYHVGIAVSTVLISSIMVFVAFNEALKVSKKP
jgi:hypothetical protein